jgi:hypothetical protein
MQVIAYEGVIENGRVRLDADVRLPENAKVFVVIPSISAGKTLRVYSPRLAHPEQAVDFRKEIVEEAQNAGV